MIASNKTSGSIPADASRFLELDVFRGVAALSVLIYHYTQRFDELYGHASGVVLFSAGKYGVDLFFMISGFVIFMTLMRTRRGLDFVASRFSRLFPAYWAAVVLTFCIVAGVGLPGREITSLQALINFSMLQEFFFVPSVDSVYWTLALELSFYAVMFAFYQAHLLARIDAICFGWMVFVIGNALLSQHFGLQLPARLQLILLTHYAHLFAAGIILYLVKHQGMTLLRGIMLVGCVLTQWYLTGPTAALYTGVALVCLLAATQGWLHMLTIKPLIFFGTISYSLYLLHQNIGYIVLRAWYAQGLSPMLGIIIATLVAIGLASGVTYFIEQPAMQMLRQQYRRFQERKRLHLAELSS